MQLLLSCMLQSDSTIKGTLTSNLRYFLVLFKIPEESARENLVKLRAKCLQIYLICFKSMFPFYIS